MADGDFSTLESIFNMIVPADMLAAQKIGLGDPKQYSSTVRMLLRLLLDTGACGAHDADDLKMLLESYRTGKNGTSGTNTMIFDRLINLYTSVGSNRIAGVKMYPYMYKDNKNVTQYDIMFNQIIGTDVQPDKKMSIILCKSPFVSPMVRNAQRAEVFLNFLPTIVMSRCVPYVDLEFAFDRGFNKAAPMQLQSAGLMKFLMGDVKIVDDSPNAVMFNSRARVKGDRIVTTSGMEMFTSPQTLINMDPIATKTRYVDVIDPTRPFASLESITINVTPQPGIMSYKKATAVIKLHDRSRMAELADLIQPTTYTQTTVWLTYGWRHPREPGGGTSHGSASATYADFINNNMLVREAYGVKNSSFVFDHAGQVTITLELYTKFASELRDMKVTEGKDTFKSFHRQLDDLAKEVARMNCALNRESSTGINKEIRGFEILDAAERGEPPSFDSKDAQKKLDELKKTLKNSGNLTTEIVNKFMMKLSDMYSASNNQKGKFKFNDKLEMIASKYVKNKYDLLRKGYDPFIIFNDKNKEMMRQTDSPSNPMLNSINKFINETTPQDAREYDYKVVSFGKLFSVFMASALLSLDSMDECQVYFYSINDQAGNASGTNLAEFPIDLPVFLEQFKEHIERRGNESLTVEEFIKFCVDTQINIDTAIPYGFREANVFKPWSKKKQDPEFTPTGKESYDKITTQKPFKKPQVEVYIESTFVRTDTLPLDLLEVFESSATSPVGKNGANSVSRLMKIHVYDKTANPYRAAALILRPDDSSRQYLIADDTEWVKKHWGDITVPSPVDKNVRLNTIALQQTGNMQHIELMSGANNQEVKHMVSKMVPTLVYGMNTSAILEASVATKHDPNLSAAQLTGLNKGKKVVATPEGGGAIGLPLKIIPAQLTLRTFGCPLLNYSQLFFVDFNTGTTLDNIYGICGMTHTMTPGKFESSLTMAFYDAYGKYESAQVIDEYNKTVITPAAIKSPQRQQAKKK